MAPYNAEQLLEIIRPHRFLYDNREADFKDTAMKDNRWAIIGKEFGMTGDEVAKKFSNLKDRWRKLKNKVAGAKKSGAGVPDVPEITWKYFAVIDSMLAKERLGTSMSNLLILPDSPQQTTPPSVCTEMEAAECSFWGDERQDFDEDADSSTETNEEPAVELTQPSEPQVHEPTKQARGNGSGGPPKRKKQKTATGPADDISVVKDAYIEAMQTVAKKYKVDRCNLFFDFVAETAKSLSREKQDKLMQRCHEALFEIQYEGEGGNY